MPERDLRFFAAVAMAAVFVVVETVSLQQNVAENWVFVGVYLAAALYAAWFRAWFAATTAASVAVVRGMVVLEYTGRWFEVASVVFAALFFLMVAVYVRQRDRIRELTDRLNDR